MIKRKHLLFIGIVGCALILTFYKIPLATSQGTSLNAAWVDGDLPIEDPTAELWQQAPAIEVPLSAQNVAKPFLLASKIKSVRARALQNSSQIAFLVEWSDSTQDNSTVAVQEFRDAVALQFPLAQGQPFFCMGQQGGNVNIWHWKADWQADIIARKEMEAQYPNMYVDYYPFAQAKEGELASIKEYVDTSYLPAQETGNLLAAPAYTTPVEDLIAGGLGSLTTQAIAGQNVQGFGEWSEGKWQVIFSRSLESSEQDDVSFTPGKVYSVAFAVWDGANMERNGQKSTSQWINLQLGNAPRKQVSTSTETRATQSFLTSRYSSLLIFGTIALLIIIGGFIYFRLPE